MVDVDENAHKSLKEAIHVHPLPQISVFDISDYDAELIFGSSEYGGIGIRK